LILIVLGLAVQSAVGRVVEMRRRLAREALTEAVQGVR
jgi:hypothetical protein